jgi:hypothetical protein
MSGPIDTPQAQGANGTDDLRPFDRGRHLEERVEAVEAFIEIAGRLVTVGDLKWADVEADYRMLAVNVALRRQLESIRGAAVLARQDLGHLAVAFVRASLEDVLYLRFFASLALEDSQKLFGLLSDWDMARSLLAQRAYIGDDDMKKLWYPTGFLDAVQLKRDNVRVQLKELQQKYKWPGGDIPSGAWIAEKADEKELYDYLHAATSRAVHFSAGEIMRRGWGDPTGKMITNMPGFRAHLAAFALDQLWRLYTKTWEVTIPSMDAAGISSEDGIGFVDMKPVLSRLLALGRVPLVHAHEWNLTPEGPCI